MPDDDAEAEAAGWPIELIASVTQSTTAYVGNRIYCRATTWQRIKAEFIELGNRH